MKNLVDHIRNTNYIEANSIIKRLSGIVDYFSSEDEKVEFISIHGNVNSIVCEDRISYGDWQTPIALAERVCDYHLAKFGAPDIVIEPTCGQGAFVFSALKKFPNISEIHALEINRKYTIELKLRLLINALSTPLQAPPDIHIYNADFFEFNFASIIEKSRRRNWNTAIIGNPPWVTNSRQGKNNSVNLPTKNNIYGFKGIDAITGKSNFDISEYITLQLLKISQINIGGISFLLKNSVIRNILTKQHIEKYHIGNIEQKLIDASSEFNVSVDASCFSAQFNCNPTLTCSISDFYTNLYLREYGWVNDSFVSDTEEYVKFSKYDGISTYIWRSGIKHDCSSVLELTLTDKKFTNGFGETVQIEDDLIYPLLKSSDINKYDGTVCRKFLIVPQRKIGDNTSSLQYTHPLAYSYLVKYVNKFSCRKSSIYRGKDIFSIFGVGEYSFKPYKIIVSSLCKDVNFRLISEYNRKPIMVDDTCYQLGFDDYEEAKCIYDALNSTEIQSLLQSLIFKDAKRVVTKNLLMRLDLVQFCRDNDVVITHELNSKSSGCQLSLFE